MKKFLGMASLLLVLTGCFGGKETTTVCKSKNNGDVTIEANGDEVTKMTVNITEDLTGYIDGSDEEIKKYLEDYYETLSDVAGVTVKVEVKDGVASVTNTVDFSKADLDELAKADIVDTAGADYISLEKTIENQEGSGYSCKEK